MTPSIVLGEHWRMKISLIAAKARNHTIGRAGKLPWTIPNDLAWFKKNTLGKPCIMGRKTWESLPKRPLPGRQNIVITRDRAFRAEGALIAYSLDEALGIARAQGAEEAMIIGGAGIFTEALGRADRLYITEVLEAYEGDVFFPLFNQRRWKVAFREDHDGGTDGVPAHIFYVLERKG